MEASSSLDYLYAELSKTPQQEIKQSISALIEGQLRTKMLANVRNDYLVRTLDSPQLPYKKSAPTSNQMKLLSLGMAKEALKSARK